MNKVITCCLKQLLLTFTTQVKKRSDASFLETTSTFALKVPMNLRSKSQKYRHRQGAGLFVCDNLQYQTKH